MSKIALVVQHSEEYQPLADITVYQNKREYCKRWDYGFEVRKGQKRYLNSGGHAGGMTWDRLDFLCELIESGRYEWVYCIGTDTMITNFTIPLESFLAGDAHLVIAADGCAPVQADSFLVRCSAFGLAYLRDVLSYYEEFRTHSWVENQVMINLNEKYKGITKIVPQRALNAYDYSLYSPKTTWMANYQDINGNDGQWHYGDVLIHWPGLPWDFRIALAKHYAQYLIIR